jgi:tetratricopeptide (TPR) repeat protein
VNSLNRFKFIVLFGLAACGLSCSSPQFRIQSNPPDAQVEVVYPSGERRILGKTPVRVSAEEVNPRKEAVVLQVTSPSHRESRVLIPDAYFNKDVEFTVQLEPLSRGEKETFERQLNQLAQLIAEIQKDIQMRSFDIAQTKISKALSEFPAVGTLYVLQGNIFFLQGRLPEALISYRKAQSLVGNSPDLIEVIDRIERTQGGGR